jgi:uncharacterized cupredoxin-like copper-binding protein
MKKYLMTLALAALATSAFASGTHEGGHDKKSVIGVPGEKSKVTQTIKVTMKETDDGKMLYIPNKISVRKGQTVKFSIRNAGEVDHEFVLDRQEANLEHKAVMAKFPEMEHDNPNAVSLAPGESGEIIWKFTSDGPLEFACLKPGHYEAGMRGDLSIAKK